MSLASSSRYFSSDKDPKLDPAPSQAVEASSLKDKVKTMWKKYGIVAIGTYAGLYLTTLSTIFFFLDFDLVNSSTFGFDPKETIHKVHNYSFTIQ